MFDFGVECNGAALYHLQDLTRLVEKNNIFYRQTIKTMAPSPKTNRAAPYEDRMKLEVSKRCSPNPCNEHNETCGLANVKPVSCALMSLLLELGLVTRCSWDGFFQELSRAQLCNLSDVTKVANYQSSATNRARKIKMGLKKAIKTLEILEKPEAIFNRRLNSNPFYPFEKVGRNSKLKWTQCNLRTSM